MTIDVLNRLTSIAVRLSATGPVSPEVVWERYADLDLWPTWSPQLQEVEAASRRLRPGLAGRVVGPLGLAAGFQVDDVDLVGRRWSWTVRRSPLVVRLAHGVDEAPDAGTGEPGSRTWLVLHGPAPVVLGYAPVAWLALHRLVTTGPPR